MGGCGGRGAHRRHPNSAMSWSPQSRNSATHASCPPAHACMRAVRPLTSCLHRTLPSHHLLRTAPAVAGTAVRAPAASEEQHAGEGGGSAHMTAPRVSGASRTASSRRTHSAWPEAHAIISGVCPSRSCLHHQPHSHAAAVRNSGHPTVSNWAPNSTVPHHDQGKGKPTHAAHAGTHGP